MKDSNNIDLAVGDKVFYIKDNEVCEAIVRGVPTHVYIDDEKTGTRFAINVSKLQKINTMGLTYDEWLNLSKTWHSKMHMQAWLMSEDPDDWRALDK